MTKSLKETVIGGLPETQEIWEYRIKLITLMALTNKYCLVGQIQQNKEQEKNEESESGESEISEAPKKSQFQHQ